VPYTPDRCLLLQASRELEASARGGKPPEELQALTDTLLGHLRAMEAVVAQLASVNDANRVQIIETVEGDWDEVATFF